MSMRYAASGCGLAAIAAANLAIAQSSRLPEPTPKDAKPAILAAFGTYSIVAMMAGHGIKDVDDFVLSLVRERTFTDVVNDIIVECTNSKYQSVLDRYIAGENIPFDEARQAWYNTQPGCADFHEALFPLIRRLNQRLPPERRLRVLAGEPAIDWNALNTEEEARNILGSGIRERSMADVVAREVLRKHRRALLLYGTTHLLHTLNGGGVNLYEKEFPGVTLVIEVQSVCSGPRAARAIELEKRMAAWPVPSFAIIRNTSFVALDDVSPSPFGRWSESIDAVLYLGPSELLLKEPMPAHLFLDSRYMGELRRRAGIPTAASDRARDLLDVSSIRNSEGSPFLCGRS